MIKKTVPLVIFASSRGDGNTRKALETVQEKRIFELVDLAKLNIGYFDYEHANEQDDFLPLAEKMQEHEVIILVTPVYWYSMSALMKTFIDRWSDLLTIRKDLGRGLKGKWVYVISSYGTSFPIGFDAPFRLTCNYMDIHFGGSLHYYSGRDPLLQEQNKRNIRSFQHLIDSHA